MSAETYPNTFKNQGHALVFVNDTFLDVTDQLERKGADHDVTYFTEAFEKCGLKTMVHRNLNLSSTLNVLNKFASDPERANDNMMAVAFSSHGEQMELRSSREDDVAADAIYCTDGIVRVSTLTRIFTDANCPAMAGKPKLFFIQACRGLNYDETLLGREGDWGVITMAFPKETTRASVEIPIFKDFFLACSTPPGYLSFRSPTTGSWFVRCLHDVIMEHAADRDLLTLLTLVKNRVGLSDEFRVKRPAPDLPYEKDRKVIPWTVSMLTKEVRFC